MGNPENKERPNQSELPPKKDPAEIARQLGRTAIEGTKKK